MKAVHVLICRHGNTFDKGDTPVMVGAKTDLALTQAGLNQAKAFASYVQAHHQPVALYTGSLKRHRQAADLLCQTLPNLQGQTHPGLDEVDYGAWEGLTPEQVAVDFAHDYKLWTEQGVWPSCFGQSGEQKRDALKAWLNDIRQYSGQTVVAISSQGLLKLLLTLYPKLIADSNLEAFKVKTGHFCEFRLTDTLEIIRWNQKPEVLGVS